MRKPNPIVDDGAIRERFWQESEALVSHAGV
jgi:hypothetical protein